MDLLLIYVLLRRQQQFISYSFDPEDICSNFR